MKKVSIWPVDNSDRISRRSFLSVCGACTACFAASTYAGLNTLSSCKSKEKTRIRIIYSLHAEKQDRPDWPNVGFDFSPVMDRINSELTSQLSNVEFLPLMATGQEEAEKILARDVTENIDGYLVYQMNCWNQVVQTIAKSGKPVLYADFQYGGSGGFLVYNAAFLRDMNTNVGFVASSKMEDLIAAVKCFEIVKNGGSAQDFVIATSNVRGKNTPASGSLSCNPDEINLLSTAECIEQLKGSKILAVRDTESAILDSFMHIPVHQIPFEEVNTAFEQADKDEAQEIANLWIQNATDVIDVSTETLNASAEFYLGMKDVLKKHDANAITINCLGGFYGGHIHAYPCLGFHQLNNEGLIGACECDIESTATMLAFTTLTQGRPGYISDPVIDTSKGQIIYAHCVGSNKVFGPDGSTNPYAIMTHSEDRQGASVRSILPVGYMTSSMRAKNATKEIIFHQAKAVDNDPDDRACRTKLCAEPVGDIEKLFTMWDKWSWHRVTYYGDLKEPAYELADATGFKIVEEA
ncbi:hypothetical protein ACFLU5_01770 [Bacteroidota bacterium]